jgi:4-hydroxy-3-polyprenylbenzoate decarboxylase
MAKKDISSVRSSLEFLKEEGDLIITDKEVDPIYECSGISKAFDGSPPILFENVKGYPNSRMLTNYFGDRSIIAKLFDIDDWTKLKFKVLDAMKNPIPPIEVKEAPSQEVVITEDIDVNSIMPVIKYTPEDAGRIIGGGNTVICAPGKGTHIGFNRAHFRFKNAGSLSLNLGSHVEYHVLEAWKEKGRLPLTINILSAPAALLATGGFLSLSIPPGSDELGIAGGIQGSPIEIVKAKTIDGAYALAQSEWVIEGYFDTTQFAWEAEEAEKIGKPGVAPFFPEYVGYKGKAYKTFKFVATGITHRKDKPIFYTLLAHGIEGNNLCTFIKDAAIFDIANKICPGMVIDVNTLDCFKAYEGTIIQVRKRRRRDEGYQRNILIAAMNACASNKWVVVVDEDINIYNADDVMWAMNTRVGPDDIIVMDNLRGVGVSPIEKVRGGAETIGVGTKMGFDATIPYSLKWRFKRAVHPEVDLKKWFTDAQIEKARAKATPYIRYMQEIRN